MNNEFDDILSRRLTELPDHKPDHGLWKNIEAALDAEDDISRKLSEMPVHNPPPSAWEAIEAALPEKPVARPLNRLFYLAASAAAAFLLLIAIPRLIRSGDKIVVESEIIPGEEHDTGLALNQEEEDALEVIRNICKTSAPVCQSELFREKMQLYKELSEELRQLETVIGQVGDSPEIIQSVIRIENLKSGTLQELIQLINS